MINRREEKTMLMARESKSKVEIRLFEEDFLEPCISLYVNVFNQAPWNESWTYELAGKRLKGIVRHKGFNGFLALLESTLVGFVIGHRLRLYPFNNYFHVSELLVDTESQGYGIGKQLMRFLGMNLSKNNIRYVSLFTKKGSPAENFYSKLGFRKMFRGISVNNLVLMIYPLLGEE